MRLKHHISRTMIKCSNVCRAGVTHSSARGISVWLCTGKCFGMIILLRCSVSWCRTSTLALMRLWKKRKRGRLSNAYSYFPDAFLQILRSCSPLDRNQRISRPVLILSAAPSSRLNFGWVCVCASPGCPWPACPLNQHYAIIESKQCAHTHTHLAHTWKCTKCNAENESQKPNTHKRAYALSTLPANMNF